MSMAVVECIEPGFVRGRIDGEFNIEDAKQAFVEILEQVEQHKASKVLVDTRTVGGEPKVNRRRSRQDDRNDGPSAPEAK